MDTVRRGSAVLSELSFGKEQAWDAYVQRTTEAGFFHLAGWKQVLEKTYSHQPRYLMIEDNGQVQGILPLFIMRSRLFGTQVRSLPGGICAADAGAGQALLGAAIAVTEAVNADHLLLSHGRQLWDGDLISVQHHCTQSLELPVDAEQFWRGFTPNLRNKIRKAEKSGLAVTIGGAEHIEDFYKVLSHRLRDLGTPVFGKRLIHNLASGFPEQLRILVVKRAKRPVGAMLLFLFKDIVYDQWSACLPDVFRDRANELLYWEALRWACQHGYRCFDFGRSQWGSGTYQFKAKWGAEARPLYYQYFIRRGHKIPDFKLKAEWDSKYRAVIWIWQRLPVGVTRLAGPRLREHLYPL